MVKTAEPDVELQDGGSELTETFERTVADGEYRLSRSWRNLLATGLLGGLDVGVGILALLLVLHETGSILLAGLGFGIGFIALFLAQSELFTENFLVPVAAVTARRGSVGQLLRLWAGTVTMNLVGGWVMMGLIVVSHPDLAGTARELGTKYVAFPLGETFTLAILGGIVITLMTWMERATESMPA
ncbi:MAG TPA: formate/nitrite transporter family protein, partial [Acidimicrobiia bacterium]|nr:formate/nitrite transporter family protein [Acidimicrobiia bacterium]